MHLEDAVSDNVVTVLVVFRAGMAEGAVQAKRASRQLGSDKSCPRGYARWGQRKVRKPFEISFTPAVSLGASRALSVRKERWKSRNPRSTLRAAGRHLVPFCFPSKRVRTARSSVDRLHRSTIYDENHALPATLESNIAGQDLSVQQSILQVERAESVGGRSRYSTSLWFARRESAGVDPNFALQRGPPLPICPSVCIY